MTTAEKKEKLIEVYKAKQIDSLNKYIKKVNSLNSTMVEQEYSIIILGKEYTPPKSKSEKKRFKEQMTYSKKEDSKELTEEESPDW